MTEHLLLSSGTLPVLGTGTGIVLKRHIERLEKQGWKITIVVPEMESEKAISFSRSWNVISLVSRRSWWPPYRWNLPGSLQLRLMLMRLECEYALGSDRPSAIITHVSGHLSSLLSANLSRNWGVPLSAFFHDQEELWQQPGKDYHLARKGSNTVLRQASRIWAVSEPLSEKHQPTNHQKISVLYPIPEGKERILPKWDREIADGLVIAHAGWLYPWQLPNFILLAKALQRVNGVLLIVSPSENNTLQKLLEQCQNVKHRESFEKNSDAISFLAEAADCILVSYSFSPIEQSWSVTSFPSKLVEFSHLGLPILILAPSFSAVSRWAKDRKWLCHVDKLDESLLIEAVMKISDKDNWIKMAGQVREYATTEFNPDRIQSQLESELAVL